MLDPNVVLHISRARELELTRAAERARVTALARHRSRRARQRASEPFPKSSLEAAAGAAPLASCELR